MNNRKAENRIGRIAESSVDVVVEIQRHGSIARACLVRWLFGDCRLFQRSEKLLNTMKPIACSRNACFETWRQVKIL